MISYEQALRRYEESVSPTRSKKWLAMPDSPRYLKNVSSTHLGIHKTNEGAIYYRLYNTNVATFYPPDSNGNYKVVTKYYDSQTTNKFMWEYGLHYASLATTDNTTVRVPYVRSWNPEKQHHEPSAVLVFDKDHKLITSESSHRDIYTMKSSADDKEKRKEFRKKVETLVTLALFRLPEFRNNAEYSESLGRPFGTSWRNSPREIDTFEQVARCVGVENTEDAAYIQAFLDMGQAVFNISASRKIYNTRSSLLCAWRKTTEEIASDIKTRQAIADEITAEDFKKALMARLLNVANLKVGTVKTAWGQFTKTLPHKYFL